MSERKDLLDFEEQGGLAIEEDYDVEMEEFNVELVSESVVESDVQESAATENNDTTTDIILGSRTEDRPQSTHGTWSSAARRGWVYTTALLPVLYLRWIVLLAIWCLETLFELFTSPKYGIYEYIVFPPFIIGFGAFYACLIRHSTLGMYAVLHYSQARWAGISDTIDESIPGRIALGVMRMFGTRPYALTELDWIVREGERQREIARIRR